MIRRAASEIKNATPKFSKSWQELVPAIMAALPDDGGSTGIDGEQVFLLRLKAAATEESVEDNAYCTILVETDHVPVDVHVPVLLASTAPRRPPRGCVPDRPFAVTFSSPVPRDQALAIRLRTPDGREHQPFTQASPDALFRQKAVPEFAFKIA
jgi:hypothetical protein